MALRDTLVYESDNIGPLKNFGLLCPVVCFACVRPSFIGAGLSVIKVYYSKQQDTELIFLRRPDLVKGGTFCYLIGTYFRGYLISRKWKRQISRDLNFAIWQKNRVKRN